MILGAVYGIGETYCGPRMQKTEFKDGKVIVTFDNIGTGLVKVGDKELAGWEIAGADGKFVPALAKLVGNTVEVSMPTVARIMFVRLNDRNAVHVKNYLSNDTGIPAEGFEEFERKN